MSKIDWLHDSLLVLGLIAIIAGHLADLDPGNARLVTLCGEIVAGASQARRLIVAIEDKGSAAIFGSFDYAHTDYPPLDPPPLKPSARVYQPTDDTTQIVRPSSDPADRGVHVPVNVPLPPPPVPSNISSISALAQHIDPNNGP